MSYQDSHLQDGLQGLLPYRPVHVRVRLLLPVLLGLLLLVGGRLEHGPHVFPVALYTGIEFVTQ